MVLACFPVNATAQSSDPTIHGIAALAAEDPAAALIRIEEVLAAPDQLGDMRNVFDLNRLAADLLLALGRKDEAAPLLAELGNFAAANRDQLGIDPVPFWRAAVDVYADLGNQAAALRNEAAILTEQRDGGLPGATIAATLERMAVLSEAAGDPAEAADFRTQAAVALSDEPTGTRGPSDGFSRIEVFYATDRARTGDDYPGTFYGSERGALDYGIAEVTIPDVHVPGAIEAPSIWRLEFGGNPARHMTLQTVTPGQGETFFAPCRTGWLTAAGRSFSSSSTDIT